MGEEQKRSHHGRVPSKPCPLANGLFHLGVNQRAGLCTSSPNWDLFISDTDSNSAGSTLNLLAK